MNTPREAAEDILLKTLVLGAPVAESIPWPHVTVLGEALTAAIEARDAEHAAVLALARLAIVDLEARARPPVLLTTGSTAAVTAVVPAEMPPEVTGEEATAWANAGRPRPGTPAFEPFAENHAKRMAALAAPAVRPVPEGLPSTTRHARYLDSTFCDPDIQLAMADAAPTPKDVTCLECRRLLVKNGLHPRTWGAATLPTPSTTPALPEGAEELEPGVYVMRNVRSVFSEPRAIPPTIGAPTAPANLHNGEWRQTIGCQECSEHGARYCPIHGERTLAPNEQPREGK